MNSFEVCVFGRWEEGKSNGGGLEAFIKYYGCSSNGKANWDQLSGVEVENGSAGGRPITRATLRWR